MNGVNRVTYGCTALVGTNKVGTLKADSDGYYDLVLGALDFHNSSGAFYPLASAKHLFEDSSSLMRRIANGNCKGECGHPKKKPGMTMREYLERIMTVEETNVCCHFQEVTIDASGAVKDKNGRAVVAVRGKVKPTGPRGEALREALENPKENVNFSVRSLTNDVVEGGRVVKHIKTIVCWDWVNEPGISVASKYSSPSLESFQEAYFAPTHFDELEAQYANAGVSLESNGISLESIREDLGWTKRKSGIVVPASANW